MRLISQIAERFNHRVLHKRVVRMSVTHQLQFLYDALKYVLKPVRRHITNQLNQLHFLPFFNYAITLIT